MEEQKRNRKCSIQRAHVLRTIIHWISMQAWDCRGQWRWTCIGGLLTNSPFGLPHTRQRHDTFSSLWPAAKKRRRGKRIWKKKSENYDRKSEGTGWQGLCGRAAEDVQVPGLFWCTFLCKISISRRQITIAERPSNDLEDRCEDTLCHCQSKQSGY